jgi:tripartite-type tricarboxylate transporter receptor subunit TctC
MGKWLIVFSLVLGALLGGMGVPLGYTQGQTDKYPTKAIDIIVAFQPGGGVDRTARLIATYAAKKWGKPVNVVNMPGGSGVIGTQKVLSASPDGYTLLMDSTATSSVMGATVPHLPFDWQKRTWVARITLDPQIFIVRADAKWNSLKEVAAAVKQDPSSFKWGSAGVGTVSGFSTAHFLAEAGISPKSTNMVVFEGNAPTLTAVAGGHIDFAGVLASEIKAMVSAGKVKPLAVIAPQRLPGFPDVPTNGEAGFPNLIERAWQGVVGPPGLQQYVVDSWVTIIKQATNDPDFRREAEGMNKIISMLGPEEYKADVMKEYQIYKSLAAQVGSGK